MVLGDSCEQAIQPQGARDPQAENHWAEHLSALFLFFSWQYTGMVGHSWAAAVSVRAMAHGRISDTLGIWLPHHQTKSVVMIAFVVEKIAVIKSPA